jgi:hypothetical protein
MRMTLFVLCIVAAVIVVTVLARVYDTPTSVPISCSYTNGGNLVTCEHDGHWFVVFGGNGGGVCHHPDCPKCRKAGEG